MIADGRGNGGKRSIMSGFTIKLIACACMLLDGVGMLISGAPAWLHVPGRMAMPLFAFLAGWACEYTRNRWEYLLRLYMGGVVTAAVQAPLGVACNPFPALLQVALIVMLCSMPMDRAWGRVQNRAHRAYALGAYVLWQAGWTALLEGVLRFHAVPMARGYRQMVIAFLGLMPSGDYGACFVLLGVVLWRLRRSPYTLATAMTAYSTLWLLMMNTQLGIAALAIPYRAGWLGAATGAAASAATGAAIDITATPWSYALQYLGFDPFSMNAPLLAASQWAALLALPIMLLYSRRPGSARIPSSFLSKPYPAAPYLSKRGTQLTFYVVCPAAMTLLLTLAA